MTVFAQLASRPYPWPFDGAWSATNTALLCLGMQRDAVVQCDASETTGRLAGLISTWRKTGGFVVKGRRGYDPAVGLAPPAAWRNARRSRDRILAVGDPGWEIVPDLAPGAGEAVVDHSGDNAFIGTDLGVLLARRGIRNLIIGGLRAETVVHATMRSANDQGFECLLLEDGTATDVPGALKTILDITRFGNGLFGVTAPIAAVEAVLAVGQSAEAARR
jgi:biuret amidohydrolase